MTAKISWEQLTGATGKAANYATLRTSRLCASADDHGLPVGDELLGGEVAQATIGAGDKDPGVGHGRSNM